MRLLQWRSLEENWMTNETFGQQYYKLVTGLEREGFHEMNARTGEGCKGFFGYSMKFPIDQLPLIPTRRTFPHVMLAEAAWMCMGTKEPWISKHAKIWDKFIEDDGTIKNAYGYRFRSHFGRDQLRSVVEALRKDPSSRQVVLWAWDPATDGLGEDNGKNVPCPLGATFNMLGGKLNCHLVHRSCDVICGFPYDVGMYTFLTHAIAAELHVGVGEMSVSMAHVHLYDVHSEIVKQMRTEAEFKEISMPIASMTIDGLAQNADMQVNFMKQFQKDYLHPFVSDKAEVVL